MADIISGLENQDSSNQNTSSVYSESTDVQKLLKIADEMNTSLKDLAKTISQSSLQDDRKSRNQPNTKDSRRRKNAEILGSDFNPKWLKRGLSGIADEFLDGISEGLSDAFGAARVQETLEGALKNVASGLGSDLENLPKDIGKYLQNEALNAFKQTKLGDKFSSSFNKGQQKYLDHANKYFEDIGKQLRGESTSSKISDVFKDLAEDLVPDRVKGIADKLASSKLGEGASKVAGRISNSKLGQGASGIVSKISSSPLGRIGAGVAGKAAAGSASMLLGAAGGPAGIAVMIGTEVASQLVEAISPLLKSLSSAANRNSTMRQKKVEAGNERRDKDMKSVVNAAYDVVKQSADRMIQAWENGIKTINQTQGYSKAELQTLIGDYAKRLQSEGLDAVISAADYTTNLTRVLESGLSGKAAEEFAYLATKLTAAIPTQDFFSYSSIYAELTANAIKNGKSQTQALEYANKQLELFASNVLYASRQISGGLGTGLQNASDLLEKAVNIANTARIGDTANIAGVLTSVSAITSAIAPDLASGIVDAIYQAAVGGNASQTVALRSLAGINASNTEFLRAFATNPQRVFSSIFKNLASLQTMSSSNYMEVAEGLSSVFGVSMDAFARVDFDYLAKAVNSMNVSTSALEANLKHLASGESTLTSEQVRIRQINEYMMDEGLAYVLDNEVARSIQEHMWQEQIALDIEENEFAVNLRGSAAETLNNIHSVIRTIMDIVNPIGAIGRRLGNIHRTIQESAEQDEEIKNILEQGKVGSGRAIDLKNLTTVGTRLNLTNSYLDKLIEVQNGAASSSGYGWNSVGKSSLSRLGTTPTGVRAASSYTETRDIQEANLERLNSAFDRMKSTISQYLGSSVQNKITDAVGTVAEKIASAAPVNPLDVATRAYEYLSSSSYGIGNISYVSKYQNADLAAESTLRAFEVAKAKAESDIRKEMQETARSTAESLVQLRSDKGEFGQSGYEAWAATASKYGISNFEEAITELGYTEGSIRSYFDALEAQAAASATLERNAREEEFWQGTQDTLNLINTNIHEVFDKGDIMGIMWPGLDTWLADIDSGGTSTAPGFRGDVNTKFDMLNESVLGFKSEFSTKFGEFRTDWQNYYIKHTTYSEHLGQGESGAYTQALIDMQAKERESSQDVVNALSEALLSNPIADLMDPTVQQNVFLAGILQGVQTIIQQNNTQGKLKLPDAISALATGMTVVDTTV